MPDAGRRMLIVGATSAIAIETARAYAGPGTKLFLVARDAARLEAVADDLRVRGSEVERRCLDLRELDRHDGVIAAAVASLGVVDVALVAHGVLPDQSRCESDPHAAVEALEVNFTSTAALLLRLARILEAQRSGVLAVISSVAGDRGRRSNYVYGAGKAGLDAMLQGLRARLRPAGVAVVTIKPGFVDTPMTAGVPKNALFISADRAGRAVRRAIERRRAVVYVPGFWRPIMALLRALPEGLFIRLPL